MFSYLIEKIGKLINDAEQSRRTTYLAESKNLAELEQRIRELDR